MSSDLVVVTFKKDLDLCRLFIRSFDRFVERELFTNLWIVITDDSDFEFSSTNNWQIIRSGHLFKSSGNGYVDQQRAKLSISQLITSDWYWVFDSKNFFIRKISHSDLYEGSCARVNVTRPSDHWQTSWNNSLNHFGLPYVDPIHNRTPYPMKTDLVSAINIEFEPLWFKKGICEFFFYNAWVLKQDQFDQYYYRDTRIFNTTLWPLDLDMEIYQPKNLNLALRNLTITDMPVWTTGLHRTTVAVMNDQQQQEWADFLIKLGLFNNPGDVYAWFRAIRLAAQEK